MGRCRKSGHVNEAFLAIDFASAFYSVDKANLLRKVRLRLPGLVDLLLKHVLGSAAACSTMVDRQVCCGKGSESPESSMDRLQSKFAKSGGMLCTGARVGTAGTFHSVGWSHLSKTLRPAGVCTSSSAQESELLRRNKRSKLTSPSIWTTGPCMPKLGLL